MRSVAGFFLWRQVILIRPRLPRPPERCPVLRRNRQDVGAAPWQYLDIPNQARKNAIADQVRQTFFHGQWRRHVADIAGGVLHAKQKHTTRRICERHDGAHAETDPHGWYDD